MSFGEAIRLVKMLLQDPSSAVAAAVAGWKYPIDRTTMAVLDLFDVTVMAHSDSKRGRPKPHGARPFEPGRSDGVEKIGNAGGRTPAEVIATLRRLGHNLPV